MTENEMTNKTLRNAILTIDDQGAAIQRLRADRLVLQGQFDRAIVAVDKAFGLVYKIKEENVALRKKVRILLDVIEDLDRYYRPDE